MMRWKPISIVAIGAALAVAAPAAAQGDPAPGFSLRKDGTIVHKASNTRFPLQVAGFTRIRDQNFDKKGRNVVISYRYMAGSDPVVARIALIHMEMMTAREHFTALRPLVGSYFGDLKLDRVALQGEGPLGVAGLKAGSAWQGRFRATNAGKPYELSLSTVDFGYWDVRVTAAYPQAIAPDAQHRIEALVGELRRTGPGKLRG